MLIRQIPDHQKEGEPTFPGPSPDFSDSDDPEGECENHAPRKRAKQTETPDWGPIRCPGGEI